MAPINRTRVLGLLAFAWLLACSRPAAPPPVPSRPSIPAAATLATFEGRLDPATGQLAIRALPAAAASGPLGRVAFVPWQDGTPGAGPADTFELVSGAMPGAGTACQPGNPTSWEGNVTVRSFFTTRSFSSVSVELLSITTGFEACNSAAASEGMSAAFGLWDYGAMAASGSASRLWRFRLPSSSAFTFTGRIMAAWDDLAAPAAGGTTFDWTPSMMLDPPHSFQDVSTTRAHVAWNGSRWVDTKSLIDFRAVGSPDTTWVGLIYPAQAYAHSFSPSKYFEADAAHGGNAIDTTGDFTVCAKFKPGANPGQGGFKVIVAKGDPVDEGGHGWALVHLTVTEPEYAFAYRTGQDSSATRAITGPGGDPGNRTYEYVCGGRNSDQVFLGAFGQAIGYGIGVTGNFDAQASSLPLVIGAAAGGLYPSTDGGVYEVIWDSRAPTLAVMNEIVAAAEGRNTYNGAYQIGNTVDGRAVTGADLGTYHLPPGATPPVSTDGSGLLDAGTVLPFNRVLPSNPTGYCVGAEVTSSNWAAADGCILGDEDGVLRIFFTGGAVAGINGNAYRALGPSVAGYAANSRHAFRVCSSAHPGTSNVKLYVDSSAQAATTDTAGGLFDASARPLLVGTCGFAPALSGARIGRVFACPTSPAAMPRVAHSYDIMSANGAVSTSATISGVGQSVVHWSRGGDTSAFGGDSQDGYDTRIANDPISNLPASYVIEASSNGGTTWATLATVRDNTSIARGHVLDLTGSNRVRMRLTSAPRNPGSSFLGLDFSVHDARLGRDDWWLALGDSLTSNVWNVHDSIQFGARLHALDLSRYPITDPGGVSGGYISDFLRTDWAGNPDGRTIFQQWMADFPGKFVSIAIGQNDCNAGTPLNTMEAGYRAMIDLALAAGKVPVCPTLRWTYTNGASTVANIQAWNARLATIIASYNSSGVRVLAGPDTYTRAAAQGIAGLNADRTHLNQAGVTLTQGDWTNWAMASVYRGCP
jgi:lysophospholipase L1-like esterase